MNKFFNVVFLFFNNFLFCEDERIVPVPEEVGRQFFSGKRSQEFLKKEGVEAKFYFKIRNSPSWEDLVNELKKEERTPEDFGLTKEKYEKYKNTDYLVCFNAFYNRGSESFANCKSIVSMLNDGNNEEIYMKEKTFNFFKERKLPFNYFEDRCLKLYGKELFLINKELLREIEKEGLSIPDMFSYFRKYAKKRTFSFLD